MSPRRLICYLLLAVSGQKLTAQYGVENPDFWRPGFSISISAGYSLVTDVKKNPSLVIPPAKFPTMGAVGSYFDVQYSTRKNWGARLFVNLVEVAQTREDFHDNLADKFPGYFIRDTFAEYEGLSTIQAFGGVAYTFSHSRFFIQSALLLGFSKVGYEKAAATAKELGTNQLYSLQFSPENDRKWAYNPALLAGSKFGFFFAKKWGIYASFDATLIRHKLQYLYSQTDEIEKSTVTENLVFKNWQLAVSGQLGLVVQLAWKK